MELTVSQSLVLKGRGLTGTVTSWREMLLTAMLMVYSTEKAARMTFSRCVRRAGT
jgi:hypothetical protein